MNILLGVTGSVAATLTSRLAKELSEIGDVQIVATRPSLYFWNTEQVTCRTWLEEDEWPGTIYAKDQPVPHIELGKWADILVIAPLTANTLAKLAHGIADNLLTCTVRAWPSEKPIVIAPAMNTRMWQHPACAEHLATFKRWYGDRFALVEPIEKRLACGDTGIGAMAHVETIVQTVRAHRLMECR